LVSIIKRQETNAQVTQTGDDPVQRGLVCDDPAENRLIEVEMADGQAAQPFLPLLAYIPRNPDFNLP